MTLDQKIAIASLVVAIIACIGTYLAVPEIRHFFTSNSSEIEPLVTPLTTKASATTTSEAFRPPETVTQLSPNIAILPTRTPSLMGKLAFAGGGNGNLEIYVARVDGTERLNITNNPADDDPVWSHDGKFIAFNSNRDGNYEIYIMNSDGTNPRRLTNNPAPDLYPTWSPDDKQIAFHSFRDGNAEIYIINVDGTGLRRLTNNTADDFSVAWSPVSNQIAFVSDRDDPNPGNCEHTCNLQIYVMNADGINCRKLTNSPGRNREPVWSPDGKYIAFYSSRNGTPSVYVMNADGTNQRWLAYGDVRSGIAWSPDGQMIAFESLISGGWGIHVVNTDGTNLKALILGDVWGPAWSP